MQHSQAKWSLSNVTPLKAAIRGGRILTIKLALCFEGNQGTDLLLSEKKGSWRSGRREHLIRFEGQINTMKEEAETQGQERERAFTEHLPYTG